MRSSYSLFSDELPWAFQVYTDDLLYQIYFDERNGWMIQEYLSMVSMDNEEPLEDFLERQRETEFK